MATFHVKIEAEGLYYPASDVVTRAGGTVFSGTPANLVLEGEIPDEKRDEVREGLDRIGITDIDFYN